MVITIVLLALLVLVVYSLSALGRVGADVSAAGVYQAQARQHALLGLSQALGDLQLSASGDDMLTGMAGISEVLDSSNNPFRHWCGVWDDNGRFSRWLASGADSSLVPSLTGGVSLALVADGSLGANGTDHEHVRALLQPVVVDTSDRSSVRLGNFAWWVGDEGVKLSAVVPVLEAPTSGGSHSFSTLVGLSNPPDIGLVGKLFSYEQIELIGVSAANRRRNFHVLGLTHYGWSGTARLAGRLNINTSSQRFWTGVAETYNGLKGSGAPSISNPTGFGRGISESFHDADPGAGKTEGGPYPSVDLFLNSAALTDALSGTSGLLLSFGDVMRPWLAVRSDTFRVRAYGDSVNPSDPDRIEATAWCEAIVQRVKDAPSSAEGRFVITYFRWLRPPNPSDPLESDI